MSRVYDYVKSYWTAYPEETATNGNNNNNGNNNGNGNGNGAAAAAAAVLEAAPPGETNGFANAANHIEEEEEEDGADSPIMISSGTATPLTSHVHAQKHQAVSGTQPDELTSLLDKTQQRQQQEQQQQQQLQQKEQQQKEQQQQQLQQQHPPSINLYPAPQHPPTALEYYFTPNNPTVQRYYRFSATPITPIVALHKKPGTGNSAIITSGVTGLLRRSAVVPSHGTDSSGNWILVSVGGRSGWARKKLPEQHFSGFTLADTFQGTEGWMGNHSFLCRGKIMLGSDAPSLFFTNILLLAGFVLHFFVLLPKLRIMEQQQQELQQQEEESKILFSLFLSTQTIFWSSVVLGSLSWITLWISATMDPGILPPVSSPIKAPVPTQDIPLGGPLGYRYCSTCNIFRPPRSKHCNSCNVCVSKFDQYVYYSILFYCRVVSWLLCRVVCIEYAICYCLCALHMQYATYSVCIEYAICNMLLSVCIHFLTYLSICCPLSSIPISSVTALGSEIALANVIIDSFLSFFSVYPV
jgi:hypothetical protein